MKPQTLRNLSLISLPWLASPLAAKKLELTVELPRLQVAEYHRPYVAAWIEDEKRQFVENLVVWYDTQMDNREGETWLKDLRQWWRKSGRNLDMPVDGVSGPTRPPGSHELSFNSEVSQFLEFPEGSYQLVVEASREVGGRELIRIPFEWSAMKDLDSSVQGEHELGTITLKIKSS